ncbi:MAG TPA: formyltransferase family protein [Bacteroidia bacterium]|jgi:hypothetical protein|nr:formyltransferase family protein [Bacteroidia bacterium]
MKQTKIAIICQNDTLWSLYAWNKALPLLKEQAEKYKVAGFWVCDEKFMNVPKNKVLTWYFDVFGLLNFLLLAIFKIIFSFITLLKPWYKTSFKSLCEKHAVAHYTINSPNEPKLTEWIKTNNIDILVIMVGHILKSDILTAPANTIINKHAALLPANKGVFPYFWASLHNQPQGISFHKVNKAIDEGDVYYQEEVVDMKLLSSMIAFYFYTYANYGKMLMTALSNAVNSKPIQPPSSIKPSYYSGPTAADYKKFKKNDGKIIGFKDLFLPFYI